MRQRGISMIELILVTGVIGLLTGLFIVSRNPSSQAAINRNMEREFDIVQIAQVVHQYKIHNKNQYPKTNQDESIVDCDQAMAGSDLTEALVPDYLTEVPKDPKTGEEYLLCLTEDGKVKVWAPNAELNKAIEIAR